MRRRSVLELLVAALALVAAGGCAPHSSVRAESEGAQVLSDLGTLERDVLADRIVTSSELDAAVSAYHECLSSYGFTMDPYVPGTPARDTPVSVTIVDDDENPIKEQQLESCRSEVDAIDSVWVLQQAASPAQLEEAERGFVACIADLGVAERDATFEEAVTSFAEAASSEEPLDGQGQPSELQKCASNLTVAAGTTALPGLAEALAALDASE